MKRVVQDTILGMMFVGLLLGIGLVLAAIVFGIVWLWDSGTYRWTFWIPVGLVVFWLTGKELRKEEEERDSREKGAGV